MKNLKKLLLLLIISPLVFISCKSDDDNSGGSNNPNPQDSYWPLALNNFWTFNTNEGEQTLTINSRISHEGNTYYSFLDDNPNLAQDALVVRENNGKFIMYFAPNSQQGLNISGGAIGYIDVTRSVNSLWNDQLALNVTGLTSGTLLFNHQGKVLDQVATEVVNGVTFQNVIKHQMVQSITNSITGETQEVTYIHWLAKGIGPIKQQIIGEDFNDIYELIDYEIY